MKELLTISELAIYLRVSRNKVIKWIEKMDLKIVQRVVNEQRTYTYIQVHDFWDWAYTHKSEIPFKNTMPNAIAYEPDWVKIERLKGE